jgi:hypothetical protein
LAHARICYPTTTVPVYTVPTYLPTSARSPDHRRRTKQTLLLPLLLHGSPPNTSSVFFSREASFHTPCTTTRCIVNFIVSETPFARCRPALQNTASCWRQVGPRRAVRLFLSSPLDIIAHPLRHLVANSTPHHHFEAGEPFPSVKALKKEQTALSIPDPAISLPSTIHPYKQTRRAIAVDFPAPPIGT